MRPPPNRSMPPGEGSGRPFPLTAGERRELLDIARRAVTGWLRERKIPGERPDSEALRAPGAAFVTLRHRGRLRGCIGYTEASAPLFRTVQECAVAAASEDSRFPSVTSREAGEVRFEISVLSPLVPVSAEEVSVGVHGLLIRKGTHRGLLLPQVATENGWDRTTFLAQLCAKADLLPDAWKEGAELYSFTAEVFGE